MTAPKVAKLDLLTHTAHLGWLKAERESAFPLSPSGTVPVA
jgi:hypothetical protein